MVFNLVRPARAAECRKTDRFSDIGARPHLSHQRSSLCLNFLSLASHVPNPRWR